jgi:hypothetical protein
MKILLLALALNAQDTKTKQVTMCGAFRGMYQVACLTSIERAHQANILKDSTVEERTKIRDLVFKCMQDTKKDVAELLPACPVSKE